MIAAKYRLFSAEPKASKFPRYAHTEEVAVLHFRFGPPRDESRMVGNSFLNLTTEGYPPLAKNPKGARSGHNDGMRVTAGTVSRSFGTRVQCTNLFSFGSNR
jgi:hypothetical protein